MQLAFIGIFRLWSGGCIALSAFLGLCQPLRWQVGLSLAHVLLAVGLVGQSRGREGARRHCLCKEELLCALPSHPDAELYCCGRTCQGWQSGSIEKPSYKINALCRGSNLSDVGFWAVKRIKAIDEEWNSVQVVCKSFSENPIYLCMQKSSHIKQLCSTTLDHEVFVYFQQISYVFCWFS